MIIGIGLLLTQKYWLSNLVQRIIKNDRYQIVVPTMSMNDIEEKRKFESIMKNYSEFKQFGNIKPIVFSSSNGVTVNFQGTIVKARNPGSHIYLNNKEIGTVGGQGLTSAIFSSDGKFFNFTTYSICGAGCANTSNYQIDLNSSVLK